MGTQPSGRRRHAAAFLAVALVLTALALPARADTQSDFQAAQTQLQQLQEQSDLIVDAYNHAAEQLDAANAAVADAQGRLGQLENYLSSDRNRVRQQAIATYKYGAPSLTQIGVLTASRSLDDYARAMKYMKAATRSSLDVFVTFAADQTALSTVTAKLRAAQTQRRSLVDVLNLRRTEVDVSIRQQQTILDQYKSQLQQQAAAEAAAAQQALAPQAGAQVPGIPGPQQVETPGGIPPADSALAQGAIDFAKAQLGKPYVYAAAGPDSYDCSGLVMKAYETVGISLPHYSAAMHDMLPSVPTPEPGDIAWHPGHVALYVGAGWDIEAPHTGDVVRYKPIGNRFQAFLRVVPADRHPAPMSSTTTTPPSTTTRAAGS